MNNDSISRQAAIDVMRQYAHYDDFDVSVVDTDIAIIALKDLPSAQQEQQWTPCSEGLPKTTEWRTPFLVTAECDTWNPRRKTLVAEWENTTVRGKPVSRWIRMDRLFPAMWKVVAWKPLSEPYGGGEK